MARKYLRIVKTIIAYLMKDFPCILAGLSFGVLLGGGSVEKCTWMMATAAWIQMLIVHDELKDAIQTTNVEPSADLVVDQTQVTTYNGLPRALH